MVNVLQQVFGKPVSGPPQINLNVTASSTTLHKHGSSNPFTLTLEATLLKSPDTPSRSLTVLIFDTLLDPKGNALYENGLDFINSNTGTHAKRPSLTSHYTFSDKSNILINTEFERYFVTLEPGVPYRVTHTMRPCPRLPRDDEATAKDENIVIAAFSHVTYLDVGSTYQVELGNKMNSISWYRYGSKDEVLNGQDIRGGPIQHLMGPKRDHERVGDSEMPAIPLVMQGSTTFSVEE